MIYNKYPFLFGAKSLFDRTVEFKFRDKTLEYMKSILSDQLYTTLAPVATIEVHSFLNSLLILNKLNNSYLTKRFIENYAKRFEYFILQDLDNLDTRTEVFDFLDIDVEKIQYRNNIVTMRVPYFLMLVRNLGSAFKPIDHALKDGMVKLSDKQFALALRTRLEYALDLKVKIVKSNSIEIPGFEEFEELSKQHHKVYGLLPVTMTNKQPPCIAYLIEKGKNTHHLEHKERVTLGIYLKAKNYDEEYILNIFRGLSDWNEKITKYQLSKLGNYKCYGCEKMEIEGLCKKSDDKLGRCGKIVNPYIY